ncbi:hypothetical protein DNTS_003948 [Danionella cerebrum]|uniref:Inactive rhomboid protein n=1 Tax=Danionella cerebrum TaxID=2873325 RepID=A0A553Q1B9_9TELE|nr:hypothetical protein DNTS_003948 [Danionella translucida]
MEEPETKLSAAHKPQNSHGWQLWGEAGNMAEPRRDSTSSLQRKKPPWLKLDIPSAQVPVDEPPMFVQPVKRHGFHRSVSMPVETSHFPSPQREPLDSRRAAFQRQSSITQTIKRGTADWFGVSKDGDATQKWQRKSLRHCSLRYGKLKHHVIREMELPSQDNISLTSTETPPPLYLPSTQHGMQKIVDPLARGRAFRMVEEVDGYSVPQTPITPGAASLCSFNSSRSGLNRIPRRRKRESVAKMSFRAAAALVKGRSLREGTLKRAHRRSFTPASFIEEDVMDFPDELDTSFFARDILMQEELSTFHDEVFESPSDSTMKDVESKQLDESELTGSALDKSELERSHLMLPLERGWRKVKEGAPVAPKVRLRQEVVSVNGQRRGQRIAVPVKKLFAREKRPYGLGMVGKLTNRTYRKRIDSYVKQQIEDMDDHRPFFTYWITFVHILITILAVCIYGIAPVGFSQHETVDSVLRNKGVYENVKFVQQENFWIGPSSEALIHLGAKFSPCMRRDHQVHELIKKKQELERNSACCVRNDRSGCLQTSEEECSCGLSGLITPVLQKKSANTAQSAIRTPGRVQSRPRFLLMSGLMTSPNGRCEITSREYCDFMKGYFHEEATLCSQVHCMDDVCGLLPFLNPEVGPAGSQFGILACLFVELIQSWQILAQPWRAFTKLLCVVLFLFAFGLLPWIDNFAHISGFISGFFLSFAFLPYISFGRLDMYRKRCQIIMFLVVFVGLFAGLVVLFYVYPIKCDWCELLTCIPFTDKFCEKYDLNAHLH